MGVNHSRRSDVAVSLMLAPFVAAMIAASIPAHAAAPKTDHAVPVPAIIAPAVVGNEHVTPLEKEQDIKAKPLSILAKYPQAGPPLAQYVAQALSKQPSLIDAILSLSNTTSPEQASAIGAGIVRAMRTLSAKQVTAYRQMSDKVMMSDNLWLKTSFTALGPNYRAYRSFNAPTTLPAREYGDFGAGSGGAIGEWKVGPAEDELLHDSANQVAYQSIGTGNGCRGNIKNKKDPFCTGMIVAVISSDAPSNGAVSTSPTM